MTEFSIKPYRKTLIQTAIILNISKLTVRRMADKGALEWSDGQITVQSIDKYILKSTGRKKYDESEKEVEDKIQKIEKNKQSGRRIISRGIER